MKIVGVPGVTLNVTIQLTEGEARALDALFGYNPDEFIKSFYTNMGKAYLSPYESDLRVLMANVRSELPVLFGRAEQARNAFKGQDKPKVTGESRP